jgi:hypothetical protein
MKKILQCITILMMVSSTEIAISQTIPNAGFENWISGTNGPEPQDWFSLNSIFAGSVVQTPGHTGTYAVRLASVSDGSGGILGGGVTLNIGPVNYKPTGFTGYWKDFANGGIDEIAACMTVYDSSNNYINDHCTYTPLLSDVPTWTAFSVPVGNSSNSATFYYLIDIHFVNISNVFTPYGDIDDLVLNYITGTEELSMSLMNNFSISCIIPFQKYQLNIDNLKNTPLNIELIDVTGKKHFNVQDNFSAGHSEFPIDLTDYASGIYFCKVSGEKINKQFKIIKAL